MNAWAKTLKIKYRNGWIFTLIGCHAYYSEGWRRGIRTTAYFGIKKEWDKSLHSEIKRVRVMLGLSGLYSRLTVVKSSNSDWGVFTGSQNIRNSFTQTLGYFRTKTFNRKLVNVCPKFNRIKRWGVPSEVSPDHSITKLPSTTIFANEYNHIRFFIF